MQILAGVCPELDLNDEHTLFARILADYGAYADLLDSDNERKKAEQDLESEYRHNAACAMEAVEQMRADEALDADEVEAAIAELKRIAADISAGIYSPDHVKWALGAMHRDRDIEAARKEGEIAGRNARIEERLSRGDGDGLPMLAGSNSGARRAASSIFDIARG